MSGQGGVALVERGLVGVPEAVWLRACEQAQVVAVLAGGGSLSRGAAQRASEDLGISARQVYALVARWRAGSGLVSDLLPGHSGGGRGGRRVAPEVEAVIEQALGGRYLTRQRISIAAVHREVVAACRARGLAAPARGTVALRVAWLDPKRTAQARLGSEATRPLRGVGGVAPAVGGPLAQVQIDHTVIDVIVVDEVERQVIGRPYLTVAIDVYSRTVVGMVVTLEAPSATSVGLCLAQVCCDKAAHLAGAGAEVDWPMSGKPARLYLDNAAEFKSDALRRGCQQHGIALGYRPGGQPHYGGIVERVIGTMMSRVHELAGTTFSNPAQRGSYDSAAKATLTLGEVERYLVLAVAAYHASVHSTLGRTPASAWGRGIAAHGAPVVVADEKAFLIDFLPVVHRTITRTGFVIDHVRYYSNALSPWIARRQGLGKFVIRRDPRDISRIWVLDPQGKQYLEVGYRSLARPAITLWEHRAATARLRQDGRAGVDERSVFAMVEQMRSLTAQAGKATRSARRQRQRRAHLPVAGPDLAVGEAPAPGRGSDGEMGPVAGAAPFEQIEQW